MLVALVALGLATQTAQAQKVGDAWNKYGGLAPTAAQLAEANLQTGTLDTKMTAAVPAKHKALGKCLKFLEYYYDEEDESYDEPMSITSECNFPIAIAVAFGCSTAGKADYVYIPPKGFYELWEEHYCVNSISDIHVMGGNEMVSFNSTIIPQIDKEQVTGGSKVWWVSQAVKTPEMLNRCYTRFPQSSLLSIGGTLKTIDAYSDIDWGLLSNVRVDGSAIVTDAKWMGKGGVAKFIITDAVKRDKLATEMRKLLVSCKGFKQN